MRATASGSARCPMAARAGSPRATALRMNTSRVIPTRTGTRASSRPPRARLRSPIKPDFAEGGEELGSGGERRPLQPLDVGLDQRATGVVVEGDPDGVLDDQAFGLGIALVAGRSGGHAVRLVEQPVH